VCRAVSCAGSAAFSHAWRASFAVFRHASSVACASRRRSRDAASLTCRLARRVRDLRVDAQAQERLQRMAMRTGIAALVLLSLACVVRADDGPTPAPTAPSLEVPEPVYDAGTVERGVTLRHAFALKNIGQAELSINAKPG